MSTDILSDLPDYGDWRPTAFDPRGLGLPDRQSWKVLPVTQTRDSSVLERSGYPRPYPGVRPLPCVDLRGPSRRRRARRSDRRADWLPRG